MKKRIGYLFMDVDGTLTDGKIYMGSNGEEFKAFNIKDGYGIHDILLPGGILPIIVTGRKSQIVVSRCKELGITNIFQDIHDKKCLVASFLKDNGGNLGKTSAAYIGDDLNDLEAMQYVRQSGGLTGCPCDAVQAVKNISDYVSKNNGGNGAVRDFIEWLAEAQCVM